MIVAAAVSGTAQAHYFRTEDQAYASCRDAIERQVPDVRRVAFEERYARGREARGRIYDFFINLELIESGDRTAHKAHCRARGFGPVESVDISEGRWDF
jgi:hypothetical protein